jgi:hypothetical protein
MSRPATMSSVTRRGSCGTVAVAPCGPSSRHSCPPVDGPQDRLGMTVCGYEWLGEIFLHQAGAGDQSLGALGEFADHKIAVAERQETHADSDVEPLLDDIDTPVCASRDARGPR